METNDEVMTHDNNMGKPGIFRMADGQEINLDSIPEERSDPVDGRNAIRCNKHDCEVTEHCIYCDIFICPNCKGCATHKRCSLEKYVLKRSHQVPTQDIRLTYIQDMLPKGVNANISSYVTCYQNAFKEKTLSFNELKRQIQSLDIILNSSTVLLSKIHTEMQKYISNYSSSGKTSSIILKYLTGIDKLFPHSIDVKQECSYLRHKLVQTRFDINVIKIKREKVFQKYHALQMIPNIKNVASMSVMQKISIILCMEKYCLYTNMYSFPPLTL